MNWNVFQNDKGTVKSLEPRTSPLSCDLELRATIGLLYFAHLADFFHKARPLSHILEYLFCFFTMI
jgi:hypothetical protein